MGLHTAEPHIGEEGYLGIGVHRAARICDAARGGQILVSNATAGIVEDAELQGVELFDLGEYKLRSLLRPQRLFPVVGAWTAVQVSAAAYARRRNAKARCRNVSRKRPDELAARHPRPR
jgi:class 3 adenylate cyclase